MTYKDKDKQRTTTLKRIKRFRAKQKGVTEGVTTKSIEVCSNCGGKGFIEYEAGLIRIACKSCQNTNKGGRKDE